MPRTPHTRTHDRAFAGGRVTLKAVMGKRTLADLSKNEQVAVKAVEAVS